MGLKNFFSRWSKGEDARAIERAEEEARMTPVERDLDQEDFEAKKLDLRVDESFAGSEALATEDD